MSPSRTEEEAAAQAVEMVAEEAAMVGAKEEAKEKVQMVARPVAAGGNPGGAAEAATELRGARASGRAPPLCSERRRRSRVSRARRQVRYQR